MIYDNALFKFLLTYNNEDYILKFATVEKYDYSRIRGILKTLKSW